MYLKLIATLVLSVILLCSLAATQSTVPQQIKDFVSAWNQNSFANARDLISPNYQIKGLPKEYVQQVLQQAFAGNNQKIEILDYLRKETHALGTNYLVLAKKGDETLEMSFVIEPNDKIVQSDIFAVETRQVSTEKATASHEYISFDFELHDKMILIDGELDGEKVQYILDSGAPVFVLNSRFEEPDTNRSVSFAQGVGGVVSSMDAKRISHMSWPGGEYRNRDVLSMDLSSLEEKLERPFAGLISFAELEPYEVYIDYQTQKIRLYALDEAGNPPQGADLSKPITQLPFTLNAHIPIFSAQIGNQKLQLGIDTGAQSNLLDESFMPRLGELISAVETDTLIGADAREIEIQSAEIEEIMVYGENFGKMRYAFSDISHLQAAYKVSIDGILGYPFLSQRPFSINYRKKLLSLH